LLIYFLIYLGVAIDLSNWTIAERFNADKGKVSDFPKGIR
jgi:hypothetical protein